MRLHSKILTVGAFALALSASGLPAQAGQRADRRDGNRAVERAQPRQLQEAPRASGNAAQVQHGNGVARGTSHNPIPHNNHGVYQNHGAYVVRPPVAVYAPRYAVPRVYGPRVIVPVAPYRHYYGPGGHFSVYFGIGSGWRYGSPYSGRVYGYAAPLGYGVPLYYGDVRLLVRPREAAVYVDGYYAGIVDDFDGVFQRLTLTTGPHEIEIEASGFQPQAFNVYVDPTRTVDLHGDLYPQ